MSDVHIEECPVCHYKMTKPFEYRCPICLKPKDSFDFPINPTLLTGKRNTEVEKPPKQSK